jgi:TonB-dependent starch-binding outer membrane protein SusC
VRWNNWDLGASLFGTFGNDIFDVQKEFYVFRNFNSNVRRDVLSQSAVLNEAGEVSNPDAKYPRLDVTDEFSRAISSFYVEDGSYVRLRSLQIGYTVPPGRFPGLENVRIYVQGENLFTITGYSGLDPALPASSVSSAGMDIRDQARGIDRGAYPSNRTFTLGFGVAF